MNPYLPPPMRNSLALLGFALLVPGVGAQDFTVDPPQVRLVGATARYTLLVDGKADGQIVDWTRQAKFRAEHPDVVQVNEQGQLLPKKNGATQVIVEVQGRIQKVRVTVADVDRPREYHFENDVTPILNRFGCNSSGCHAQQDGQNGFKLSVFGFDMVADYNALTRENRGRRIFPAAPELSLLLAKPAGDRAHGGGVKIRKDSAEYETLRGWIAAGAPFGDPKTPGVKSLRVEPGERIMASKTQQQLRIIAVYEDGVQKDVTHHARFQSNSETLGAVSPDGLVSVGAMAGDLAVMAHYMGSVATFRALIPRSEKIAQYPKIPVHNFIDEHVQARLKKLNLVPSGLADDAEYLRRVYLDVIGTLPTATEARRFLDDKNPAKRSALVDELLERPEFADFWTMEWADTLRVERTVLGHKRAYAMYRWIRDSFAQNKPFDQFARELLTAEGQLGDTGPANFYKVVTKPGETASSLSQVFLGIRIACAECHHHPFDRWSQSDYYGMQAFFTQLSIRPTGRGDVLLAQGDPVTKHPRTGDTVHPHPLGTEMPESAPTGDRRTVLADWMTSPKNPWFAKNIANRVWAHMFGRGVIDPIDDMRETNPPSNPELLDALARHVAEQKFDLKQLIRTIAASYTYQQASRPGATNLEDSLNFSRSLFRALPAEVLLDMVSQTTGIEEKFVGAAPGTRAIQLWDSKVPHYFLKLFGRPQRLTACICERVHEPTVSQVLHLLNSPEIQNKLSNDLGAVARMTRQFKDDGKLAEELYLTFFSRLPSAAESAAAVKHLAQGPRRQAAEDLAWSLLNSLEFRFNH